MQKNNKGRREFLKKSALVGTALYVGANPTQSHSQNIKKQNILSKAYAGFDESGILKPFTFERRALEDDDILIDIKYSSICHSDIHQIKGDWGKQQYPQVPGHEIAGVVRSIGKNVKNFKVGDRVGVGCMVDGCTTCEDFKQNEEQYHPKTKFTYGNLHDKEPTGITQGGYSTNIVVNSHFAVHIPDNLSFENAAPLLCAGVTVYSPFIHDNINKGMKIGVAGIGGLGHMAVKLAAFKGAEVYAFTTSKDKTKDIKDFGAKDVIVVDSLDKLSKYKQKLDYMICTIPEQFDIGAYSSTIKPYGTFVQVGMPKGFELSFLNIQLAINRVNYRASLIGGMKDTQDIVNYCAKNGILPKIKIIKAQEINDAWKKVLNKKARYRYVIDTATI